MKRLVRVAAVVAVVAGTAVAAQPASSALGTWTKISAPKGPGQVIRNFQNQAGSPTINVSGTTSADLVPGTNTINIFCFYAGDQRTTTNGALNAAPLAISASHTFSGPIPSDNILPSCVLRAIPDSYTGLDGIGHNDGYAGAFAGPTFHLGIWATTPTKHYGEA